VKGIGTQYARQDKTNEVLLTVPALKWLTDTCILLAQELRAWQKVMEAGALLGNNRASAGPVKLPLEQAVLIAGAQAQSYRLRRESLRPKPKFQEQFEPA
jgi:hypothetical protein